MPVKVPSFAQQIFLELLLPALKPRECCSEQIIVPGSKDHTVSGGAPQTHGLTHM